MGGGIYMGRLRGIPLWIHWSWFLAVLLIAYTLAVGFLPVNLPQYRGQEIIYWVLGVVCALGLFASVLLHELGHAVVAQRYEIPVRAIRLFIFGGVAELGGEPRRPSHEVLMALGGPAVTLVLMILFTGVQLALFASGVVQAGDSGLQIVGSEPATWLTAVLRYLSWINLLLLIFNMIPAFPLDGGRVFRGILWALTGSYLDGTRIAGAVGIGFSWLLFLGGFAVAMLGNFLTGMWFFFLGMFLRNAAQTSVSYAQLQELLGGIYVRDMMRHEPITIDANLSLRDAVEQYFLQYPYKAYPVTADGSYLGMLTLRRLQEVGRDEWDVLRAGELVSRYDPLPTVRPDEPVLVALRKMAETGHSRLPVVYDGILVGLISRRDIMDGIEIRSGLSRFPRTVIPADDRELAPRP